MVQALLKASYAVANRCDGHQSSWTAIWLWITLCGILATLFGISTSAAFTAGICVAAGFTLQPIRSTPAARVRFGVIRALLLIGLVGGAIGFGSLIQMFAVVAWGDPAYTPDSNKYTYPGLIIFEYSLVVDGVIAFVLGLITEIITWRSNLDEICRRFHLTSDSASI